MSNRKRVRGGRQGCVASRRVAHKTHARRTFVTPSQSNRIVSRWLAADGRGADRLPPPPPPPPGWGAMGPGQAPPRSWTGDEAAGSRRAPSLVEQAPLPSPLVTRPPAWPGLFRADCPFTPALRPRIFADALRAALRVAAGEGRFCVAHPALHHERFVPSAAADSPLLCLWCCREMCRPGQRTVWRIAAVEGKSCLDASVAWGGFRLPRHPAPQASATFTRPLALPCSGQRQRPSLE
jgi:hypothetical protein